jgi:hypothetical protein
MTAQAKVAIDPGRFRAVLGHFCTGVTVITAAGGNGPVGFACQAFAALSLDPPLVSFDRPLSGNYNIWVGVLGSSQTRPATVYVSELDPRLQAVATMLEEARINVDEAISELERHGEDEGDPARLDQVNRRIDTALGPAPSSFFQDSGS